MSPDLALQKAVLARLRADAALTALVGSRVHDEPPATLSYPYLALTRAETRPWGGVDGEGCEHVLTLSIASRFEGAEEAKAVVAAVRAALDPAALTLDDHRLVNLRCAYADVFRSADWRMTFGVVRVRAVTEPL